MPSFLKDIRPFYGTGERNERGQTLEEFLEEYDPDKYPAPSCTTDAVILECPAEMKKDLEGIQVLLVKRKNHPSIGYWALPGGFIQLREDLEDTARRELEEETGVTGIEMEQLATYGSCDRDPRNRVITTAYMALVPAGSVKVRPGDDAADAVWCEVRLTRNAAGSCERKGRRFHREECCLELMNEERNLHMEVLVEHLWTGGWIREQYYRVLEPGLTAADHGAILTQAMVTMQERAERKIL